LNFVEIFVTILLLSALNGAADFSGMYSTVHQRHAEQILL